MSLICFILNYLILSMILKNKCNKYVAEESISLIHKINSIE